MSKLQRFGVLGVRVLGAGVALSVVALAANCGSSGGDDTSTTDTGGGGGDTGPGGDTTPSGDVKTDGGGDTAKGDSATPDFTPTLVAEGNFDPIQASGMTTDDHFIAVDDKGNAVAIPIAGGAPITITDGAVVADMAVWGKTVLVWKSVNKTTSVGTLVAWTKANGAKTLTTTSILGEAAASDDGSMVVYADNARTAGKVFDYSISKTDGTGVQKAVITNVMEDTTKCAAQSGFAGTHAVVAWCAADTTGGDGGVDAGVDVGADVGGDGSTTPAAIPGTISMIDASGAVTALKTNAVPQYAKSKDGTKITLLTQAGAYSVLAVGGAETPIATGVTFGGMFPEGNKVLYVDTAKDLYAATVGATPAPVKLASGVGIFYNPIEGATHVIYGTKQDSTGNLSDMFLAPVGGGAPITLSTAATATIFGDQWTADKSLVTIYSPAVGATGTLLAIDPAAPAPKTIATNSWVAYSPKGSMIVYNDNYNDTGDTSGGSSDIHIVDAKTNTPKLMAVQAGSDFYLTTARDKVCFASVDPSLSKTGLYCVAIP